MEKTSSEPLIYQQWPDIGEPIRKLQLQKNWDLFINKQTNRQKKKWTDHTQCVESKKTSKRFITYKPIGKRQ